MPMFLLKILVTTFSAVLQNSLLSYNKTQAFNQKQKKTKAFMFMATKYWTGVCVHAGNDVPMMEANNYFNFMVNIKCFSILEIETLFVILVIQRNLFGN